MKTYTQVGVNRKLRERAKKFLSDFRSTFRLIGICNGFQAMIKLGILPELDQDEDSRGPRIKNF